MAAISFIALVMRDYSALLGASIPMSPSNLFMAIRKPQLKATIPINLADPATLIISI